MSSATTWRFWRLFGHVARDDPLRQPLGDRRLAHAWLADQDRVVLGPPAEDLDDAADLGIAADNRVDLALAGELDEVAAVAFQGLVLVFGVLVGHALATADLLERLEHLLLGDAQRRDQRAWALLLTLTRARSRCSTETYWSFIRSASAWAVSRTAPGRG